MKKTIFLILTFFCLGQLIAQTDGMYYQAVVIGPEITEIPGVDDSNNVLKDTDISVRFTITDGNENIEYQELHATTTDALGMFSLMIGQGNSLVGVYTEIFWYGEPKNLKVEIDIGEGFVDFENKTITFTPHAYHRDVYATGYMVVDGYTEFKSDFEHDGNILLNNGLEVANEAATNLSGTLEVGGATIVNNDVLVANGAATELSGTLTVDGITNLNDELSVLNASTTQFTGDLDVAKNTQIDSDLTVNQAAVIDSISTQTLLTSSDQEEFLALYENINGADGDGIAIRLGRTHGAWDGNAYLNVTNPLNNLTDPFVNVVKNWLNGGAFKMSELIEAMPNNVKLEAQLTIFNEQINIINNLLGLPRNLPEVVVPAVNLVPQTTLFNGLRGCTPQACFRICFFGGCRSFCIPPWRVCANVPRLVLPSIDIPETTLLPSLFELPEIPNITTQGLFEFEIPNFRGTSVSNSLSSVNEYMTFADKDGRKTGAIKAQSVQDFRDNTLLDNVYVLNVMSSFVGIDLLDGFVSGTVEISNLIDSYNKIGVEYSSGHGDYAEWLERTDEDEHISAGDIVAVIGGKISRHLEGAEQLMVVSHKPIVLGNMPEEEKEHLGNSVAFMGQVPVKVIGSVKSGDYIVADPKILGYGRAIAPQKMKSEDYLNVVGRSWEEHPNKGPKVVNTVVGIQNGDWIRRTQKMQNDQEHLDSKLEHLEATLDHISLKIELLNTQKEKYVKNK